MRRLFAACALCLSCLGLGLGAEAVGFGDILLDAPFGSVFAGYGMPDRLEAVGSDDPGFRDCVRLVYDGRMLFYINKSGSVEAIEYLKGSGATVLGVSFGDGFSRVIDTLGQPTFYSPGELTFFELEGRDREAGYELGMKILIDKKTIERIILFVDRGDW